MLAPLVLALALAPQEPAAAAVGELVELEVTLEPGDTKVEIGQPLTLTLTAVHPRDVVLELPEELLPPPTWVVLEELGMLTLAVPGREGFDRTVSRYLVASLDSGERELPLAPLRWKRGAKLGSVVPERPQLVVAGALAEGEDAPRPARGFRSPELAPLPITRWPWVAGGLVLLGVAVFVLRRRPRRVADEARGVAPQTALAELAQRMETLGVRATCYELTHLVRAALDARLGGEADGLTDGEWLARRRAEGRLGAAELDELAALFARCEEVKYARAEPTRWALEESLAAARRLADATPRAHADGGEVAA